MGYYLPLVNNFLYAFINNRIKSEIAGTIWGKDESASIRLALDNQVSEALKYFNEANAFLGYRN